ncbi:MAG: sigma-70 family RNA polymerase sigma factor [Nitrococcus sp.]|nr:sigma-70 family RNA polymerase sigma factor [Nitrococcus sp.]
MSHTFDAAELIRLHARELRYFLRRRYGSHEDEDLLQDGFVRLLQNQPPHQPRAWLYRTCANLAADSYDRQRVRDRHAPKLEVEESSTELDPARAAEARERLQRVTQALQQQPAAVRQVFLLNRVDGLSQRAIAKRLGISEKTVERHVVRGLTAAYEALRKRVLTSTL